MWNNEFVTIQKFVDCARICDSMEEKGGGERERERERRGKGLRYTVDACNATWPGFSAKICN